MKNLFIILFIFLLPISAAFGQKNPRGIELNWKTDLSQYTISPDEFTALMPPDRIPPIDDPVFWDKKQVAANYFDHEPVVAFEINGKAKAYPLTVLTFHEIVNDSIGNVCYTVTYCPLCNSSPVYNRKLEHKGDKYLLDFGVSGMLRNSNLVLYDRQTQSWWQQLTGRAEVGQLTGAELDIIPSYIISTAEFFESFPEGKILSTETGVEREYGSNPYENYDSKETPPERFFPHEVDKRLPAMERIINIQINGKHKIYPQNIIEEKTVINDRFQNQAIAVFHTSKMVSILDKKNIEESKTVGSSTVLNPVLNGQTYTFEYKNGEFVDKQTGSSWDITGKCIGGKLKGEKLRVIPYGVHFAFAWLAFYPETDIYEIQ
jgi:hypothetical protein